MSTLSTRNPLSKLLQPAGLLSELSERPALALLAAATSSLTAWWFWRSRRSQEGKFAEVPGWPILGSAAALADASRGAEVLEGWAREYGLEEGVFEVSVLGDRLVCFSKWEACQPVLAARPFKARRPRVYSEIGLLATMVGIFFAEGAQWSTHRRLVSPFFNARATESYMPNICKVIGKLVEVLGGEAAKGQETNISDTMRKFNGDVISKVAFSSDFGALGGDSQELRDICTLSDAMNNRWLALIPYWKVPVFRRFYAFEDEAYDRLTASMEQFLKSPAEGSVLGKLTQAEGGKLTREELLGNMQTLFFAGTETSTHTGSWSIYELARNQALQKELAAEAAQFPTALDKAQNLDKLLLAQAVWKESLRLHSVVPMLDLELTEPLEVQGRVLAPKTTVMLLFREMCRNSPEYREKLGEDFDEYRPKRWLASGGGLVECKHLDTLGFGHGSRMCIGMRMANTVGPVMLSELVKHFHIGEWSGPPMKERTSFTVCPAKDVKVYLTPRAPVGGEATA